MKKLLSILLIASCAVLAVTGQEKPRENERPKVGVVLSGGSAKGFAHVGVLKVLERAGIPIDCIAGTSMGAVVGGLYSVGYSANVIDSLISLQDWDYLMRDHVYREYLPAKRREDSKRHLVSLPYQLKIKEGEGKLSLPPGVFAGQNIYSLFLNMTIGFQHPMDFDDLPIPFACVAADVRTGQEVVFREGVLPMAMRASMAIPGVFTPVKQDSMLLIDGGMINNTPVDVAREMGADFVIAVSFPPDEKAIEKGQGSITEVVGQIGNFIGAQKRIQNLKDADLLITPLLHPYGSMDFYQQAIDSIIARGEEAAMREWEGLMNLKRSLGFDSIDSPRLTRELVNPYINVDTLLIKDVRVEGVSPREERQVLRWIPLLDDKVTRKQLDAMTARVFGTGLFSSVHYRLDGEGPFDLVFNVEPKVTNTLNLGFYFDSEDMAAILANTTIRLSRSLQSMFDITTRLSRDPYFMVDYSINSGLFYKGGINYTLSRSDLPVYHRGNLFYNARVVRNALTLNFSEFYFGDVKLYFGAGLDNYHFSSPLLNPLNLAVTEGQDQLYINYTFNGVYDNLNDTYFPSSGNYFSFQYCLHTDNFAQLNNDHPLSVLRMNLFKSSHLFGNAYFTPRLAARYVMSENAPNIYRNFVGGRIDGHYLPQQIAVRGSRGMELLGNLVLSADMGMHYAFTPKNHLYGNVNFTIHSQTPDSFFKGEPFWSGNIGYSHLTIVGPLRAEVGYSHLSRRFYPYLSIGYHF